MLSAFTEWSRRVPSDMGGRVEDRVSGSERVKLPTTIQVGYLWAV